MLFFKLNINLKILRSKKLKIRDKSFVENFFLNLTVAIHHRSFLKGQGRVGFDEKALKNYHFSYIKT